MEYAQSTPGVQARAAATSTKARNNSGFMALLLLDGLWEKPRKLRAISVP
jgi:hypothetical protein